MDRLIKIEEVMKITGLSKSGIYKFINNGTFPKPIKMGTASMWSALEIQDWIAQKRKYFNSAA